VFGGAGEEVARNELPWVHNQCAAYSERVVSSTGESPVHAIEPNPPNKRPQKMRYIKFFAIVFVVLACVRLASTRKGASAPSEADTVFTHDLTEYRAQHPTRLNRQGPPPAAWQDPTPLRLPAGVREVTYQSGSLALKAWINNIPDDGRLRPAVVFCHGGFWFGNEDWDVLQPFLNAGFVVMAPRVRAENGNPGNFEYYYGEVDDAIAAGRFLARQKGVDPARLFISGHSAGGDLAALAAMKDNPFAMSAPIGAGLDARVLVQLEDDRHKQLVVFDAGDAHEVESRSALLFTSSMRCPVALFHGDKDWRDEIQKQFVALAHGFKKEASLNVVPGTHGESLPNAIPAIVTLFQGYKPASPR
jgi:dipeptidyl aminopeptidase/acylaminoacyl peptidase